MITTTPTSGQARTNHKRTQRALYWQHFPAEIIWDGDSLLWGSAHQSRVMDWLTTNGIDAPSVSATSPITLHDGEITFTVVLRNDNDRPYADGSGQPASEVRMVALLVPFTKETNR